MQRRNWVFLRATGSPRKGKMMNLMMQGSSNQKHKEQMQMWTECTLGAHSRSFVFFSFIDYSFSVKYRFVIAEEKLLKWFPVIDLLGQSNDSSS